jgi:hypothetical protein
MILNPDFKEFFQFHLTTFDCTHLITTTSGVDFDKCYRSRIEQEIEGVLLPFIDLPNLKANKRATGRAQDLADIENLE